jgi:ABC-2 type transport system permease protein
MIAASRTQNARLVQSMFVLVFPFMYITTSQAPLQLLPKTFATLAALNPVTYVLEGVRALVLSHWGDPAIGHGFISATLMFVALVSVTVASFQKALK